MEVIEWIAFVAGALIVFETAASMVRTLVLPRGLSSRLTTFVGRRVTARAFQLVADRFDEYEPKDRILAWNGPMQLITVLLAWLSLFLLGYGLMLWPLDDVSLLQALRESGSSLFTLGFAATPRPAATVVYFLAAATGLIVVALQIAYLPTLYSSFNRRETLVTMLQSRAGSPAWGPEILSRAHLVGLTGSLPDLYSEWERWAADVAESHTNYPVLVWWRSPHALRSWVVGLLAVMDSAAMYNALNPTTAPIEARLVLRMGFTCLRDVASAIHVPFDPDPLPTEEIELTYDEFHGGAQRLLDIGFPTERTIEEAWPHFRGWRVNYEAVAYAIADRVSAPPGPWSGPRAHLPGIAIIPQRPADRRPDDTKVDQQPRAERFGWHA